MFSADFYFVAKQHTPIMPLMFIISWRIDEFSLLLVDMIFIKTFNFAFGLILQLTIETVNN